MRQYIKERDYKIVRTFKCRSLIGPTLMLAQVYVRSSSSFLRSRDYFPLPCVSLPVRARKWDGSAEDGLFDEKSDRCTGRKRTLKLKVNRDAGTHGFNISSLSLSRSLARREYDARWFWSRWIRFLNDSRPMNKERERESVQESKK